ncbi:CPBP family intramembrane glutamic endopeptidase [Arthrobacter sp. 35W]|uniref:CPBP family intramembrane glutamic endopeptidase n=1 Tax=Arthrobacter sp. 35W TaxID=1132441 RepID=UPI000415BDDE|nr:CPBP family intramembrane glutamic endopeptidase [Arthrobacter sp. 35W]
MIEKATPSPWKRFWERGGWWKALALAAVYFALYELGSMVFIPLALAIEDKTSGAFILATTALPILLGSLLLVLFALSTGWLKELFARQPIRGRGWMWIAVAVVLVFNVLRMATVDYNSAGFGVVAAWLLTGLLVGFAEETLTRGLVVNLLRKAGYREIAVAALSSAVFAGLHAGNLLSGQSLFVTAFQLVYTFGFGMCMYLALRVTGNLLWPILLHASTDPSIFLQTAHPAAGPLASIAGMGNIAVILVGLVALLFIRGRVAARALESGLVDPSTAGRTLS